MSDSNMQEKPVDIHSVVREHYGKAAEAFKSSKQASCCSSSASSCCGSSDADTLGASKLYPLSELDALPEDVTGLSMGCGDPITLASLQPGQTVLDLGSGGGIDCFMAAKKVGEQGKVIGVDMTPEMLEKARANQARMGFKNVEFRLGEIEHLPVADQSVDVIISNCVINLSPDKPQVFGEALRVLKPGGRLAGSDIVTDGPLPQVIKDSLSAWAGCVAGALDVKEYITGLETAGFTNIEVNPVYFDDQTLDAYLQQAETSSCCGSGQPAAPLEVEIDLDHLKKAIFSAKITAHKNV